MSHPPTATPTEVAPAHIPLSCLRRNGRSDKRVVRALVAHIRRWGMYPPLIVAAAPDCPGQYEVIDGAARAEALARLGANQARCEVWPVGPADLPLLGLAFRRIHGRQDVAGQASALRQLAAHMAPPELATLLAMTPRALRRQLAELDGPPRPALAEELPLTPVVFHLDAAQHRRLELAMKSLNGRNVDRRGRGEMLMTLLEGTNHV